MKIRSGCYKVHVALSGSSRTRIISIDGNIGFLFPSLADRKSERWRMRTRKPEVNLQSEPKQMVFHEGTHACIPTVEAFRKLLMLRTSGKYGCCLRSRLEFSFAFLKDRFNAGGSSLIADYEKEDSFPCFLSFLVVIFLFASNSEQNIRNYAIKRRSEKKNVISIFLLIFHFNVALRLNGRILTRHNRK